MPTINLTNKQAAKIQNATDIYNADTTGRHHDNR